VRDLLVKLSLQKEEEEEEDGLRSKPKGRKASPSDRPCGQLSGGQRRRVR
jgi:ABC-type lipoprotein export system ATPase subunit